MDKRSKESLKRYQDEIVNGVNPENIMDQIRSKNIVTDDEYDKIFTIDRQTWRDSLRLMVKCLLTKDQVTYTAFIEVLREHYEHIAIKLESFNLDPPAESRSSNVPTPSIAPASAPAQSTESSSASIISIPAHSIPRNTSSRVLVEPESSTNTEPDPPGASSSSSSSSTPMPSIPLASSPAFTPPAAPDPPEENPSPSSNSTPTPSIQPVTAHPPANTSSTVPGIGEPSTTKKRIFISYTRNDEKFAFNLRNHLEEAGYSCWIDVKNIPSGSVMSKVIADGISEAGLVIFCISKSYIESDWCEHEVKFSNTKKIRGIPLKLDDVSWPPNGRLRGCFQPSHKYSDFRLTDESGLQFHRNFMLLLRDILSGDGYNGLDPNEKDVTNRYRNWFKNVATEATSNKSEVPPSPKLNYEIVLVSPEKAGKDTSILLDIFDKAKISCWHRTRAKTDKGVLQEADEVINKAQTVVLYLTNNCGEDEYFTKQCEMSKFSKKQLRIFPLALDDDPETPLQLDNTLVFMLKDMQVKRVPALNPEELRILIRDCQEIQRHSTPKSRFNCPIPGNVLFVSFCAVLLAIVCSFIYKN